MIINNITKVAAIQMCSSHILEENLENVKDLIIEASLNNAKLVALPEMFAVFGELTSLAKEEFKVGKIQSFLSKLAKDNDIWIVGGTIPIKCISNNKYFAASIVFNKMLLIKIT